MEAILHASNIRNAVELYPRNTGNLGFIVRHNSTLPVLAADKETRQESEKRALIPKLLRSQAHRVQNQFWDIQGLWLLQQPDLCALLWKFDMFHLPLEIKSGKFKNLARF